MPRVIEMARDVGDVLAFALAGAEAAEKLIERPLPLVAGREVRRLMGQYNSVLSAAIRLVGDEARLLFRAYDVRGKPWVEEAGLEEQILHAGDVRDTFAQLAFYLRWNGAERTRY